MNKLVTENIPDLEERFLEPKGWRWHSFKHKDQTLRFGSVFPDGSIPDAVVICLPGLSEFIEKYFETARTCLEHNLAFYILDWMGQGLSDRYIDGSQKRHSQKFQDDVEDLHYFFIEYIKHSCVHPDKGRIPVAMLAHSMGANIGIQYLKKYPDVFECAAFTAPMFGLQATKNLPFPVATLSSYALKIFAGKSYAPGGSDWSPSMRPESGPGALSSDPVRVKVHKQWFEADPRLQTGFVTNSWLHQAITSCSKIQKKSFLDSIKTPSLITAAGKDILIDNDAVRQVAKKMPNSKLVEFPESLHEILMERDEIRNIFFEDFYTLIKENIINRPETLKPF